METYYAYESPPPELFDISIIHKTYTFYRLLHRSIGQFPKRDRFTIGQTLESTTLKILSLLFRANTHRDRPARLQILFDVDIEIKIVKTLVRLSYDTEALKERRYLSLEEHLQELGRMLGGWIKHTRQEPSAP